MIGCTSRQPSFLDQLSMALPAATVTVIVARFFMLLRIRPRSYTVVTCLCPLPSSPPHFRWAEPPPRPAASFRSRGVFGLTCSEIFRTVHGSGCIDIMQARGFPVWSRSIAIGKHQESDRYQARRRRRPRIPDPSLAARSQLDPLCARLACGRWGEGTTHCQAWSGLPGCPVRLCALACGLDATATGYQITA